MGRAISTMSQTAAPAMRRGTPAAAAAVRSPKSPSPMSPTSPKKTLYGKSNVAGAMEMLKKIKAQGAEVSKVEAARAEVETEIITQQERVVAQKQELNALNGALDQLKDQLAQSTWALLAFRDSTNDAKDANSPTPTLGVNLEKMQAMVLEKQAEIKIVEWQVCSEERRNIRCGTRLRLANQLQEAAKANPTETYTAVAKELIDLGNQQLKLLEAQEANSKTTISEINTELSLAQRQGLEWKQAAKTANHSSAELSSAEQNRDALRQMLSELEKPAIVSNPNHADHDLAKAIANEEGIESNIAEQHSKSMEEMSTKLKVIQQELAEAPSEWVEKARTGEEDLYVAGTELRSMQDKLQNLRKRRDKLPSGIAQEYAALVKELNELNNSSGSNESTAAP